MKKKILITGTTGFLGREFVKFICKEKKFIITELMRAKKNSLSRNNHCKHNTIFYTDLKNLEKLLSKKKFDYLVHFATHYKKEHVTKDIYAFNEANILFPTLLLDLLSNNLKKFISFGTMMEHSNKKFSPQNLYAASKKAFETLIEFYKIKNKNCKFYNIKIFDTFNLNDKRKKIIPTLINNIDQNKKITLDSKNLKMNIISPLEINNFILKLLNKNISSDNFILKNKKNTNILKLIKFVGNLKNKKIKLKIKNNKKNKFFNFQKKYFESKIVYVKFDLEKYLIKNL